MKKNILLAAVLCFCLCGMAQLKIKNIATKTKTVSKGPLTPLPSPVGKWYYKGEKGTVDSLIIRSDSTYRFAEYQPGVSTPESFGGKWKVKKTDVFLYAGADPEPYGQVRAVLSADAKVIEKLKIVRYFGELQKGAVQIELKK